PARRHRRGAGSAGPRRPGRAWRASAGRGGRGQAPPDRIGTAPGPAMDRLSFFYPKKTTLPGRQTIAGKTLVGLSFTPSTSAVFFLYPPGSPCFVLRQLASLPIMTCLRFCLCLSLFVAWPAALPAQALKRVKGDKPFAHPAYWAAFVLVGDLE